MSLSPVIASHTCLTFIDTPEVLPGQVPGAASSSSSSSRPVRGSSTPTTATPVPVHTGGHVSIRVIVGCIVGSIVAIPFLVVAYKYWRRRHPRASSAAQPVPESASDSLSALFAYNSPMRSPQLSRAHFAYNSPMRSPQPSRAQSFRNPYAYSPLP